MMCTSDALCKATTASQYFELASRCERHLLQAVVAPPNLPARSAVCTRPSAQFEALVFEPLDQRGGRAPGSIASSIDLVSRQPAKEALLMPVLDQAVCPCRPKSSSGLVRHVCASLHGFRQQPLAQVRGDRAPTSTSLRCGSSRDIRAGPFRRVAHLCPLRCSRGNDPSRHVRDPQPRPLRSSPRSRRWSAGVANHVLVSQSRAPAWTLGDRRRTRELPGTAKLVVHIQVPGWSAPTTILARATSPSRGLRQAPGPARQQSCSDANPATRRCALEEDPLDLQHGRPTAPRNCLADQVLRPTPTTPRAQNFRLERASGTSRSDQP